MAHFQASAMIHCTPLFGISSLVIGIGLQSITQAQEIPDGQVLFSTHCAECHDASGRGTEYRDSGVPIPDFTSPIWRNQRSQAALRLSILQGKGDDMPPFEDVLTEIEAKSVLRFINAFSGFAPATHNVSTKSSLTKDRHRFSYEWTMLRLKWQAVYADLESRESVSD